MTYTNVVRHIPHPCSGWYYCGYIPPHRYGVPLPRHAPDDAPICRKCLAARAAQMRAAPHLRCHGDPAVEGDFSGASL